MLGWRLLKAFGKPDFNDGLTRNPEPACFAVKGLNHPGGKIYIDSF